MPSSFLNANGVISPPANQDTNFDNAAPVTVVVWDYRRPRLEFINRIVAESGARSRWVQALSDIAKIEASFRCSIALVGIGGRPSADDFALNAIRSLKQKGFQIICYEDGAHTWPLGMQCRPLLAGSFKLLDSSDAAFAQELRHLLLQLLQASTVRRDQEEKLRAVMRRLGVVGESQSMISIFRWILRVSMLSDLPTLITGETGTGKQILAHALHQLDPKRRNGPFVAINCSAINPSLAESELFGHRRGAFTGAERDRKGLIRSAQGGILFLDEVGELDDMLQAKLLRVLQENRVLSVGEDREVPVDVRVIAATNRDLDKMVQQGQFRHDLFHRLNVLSIHIPPLRERPTDVKPLVEFILRSYRSLNSVASCTAGADFLGALMRLDLPGNIRQLENLVRQALINKDDDTPLNLSDLPVEVWRQLSGPEQSHAPKPDSPVEEKSNQGSPSESPQADLASYLFKLLDANGWSLSRSLQHCEKLFLEAAVRAAQGNQSQTARLLGITPRSVYNKFRKYSLHR